MLELPHTLVGATLATKIGNPLISLPLALVSHFLTDLLPHWHSHIYTEVQKSGKVSLRSKAIIALDSSLSLLVGLALAFRFFPDWGKIVVVLLGCLLATLPDLIEAPYYFLHSRNKYLVGYLNFHRKHQVHAPIWLGILSQGIIMALLLWILFI